MAPPEASDLCGRRSVWKPRFDVTDSIWSGGDLPGWAGATAERAVDGTRACLSAARRRGTLGHRPSVKASALSDTVRQVEDRILRRTRRLSRLSQANGSCEGWACVTVRCHSGGADVEGTRHTHVGPWEAGSLGAVRLASSPFETASALHGAVIGVGEGSGQSRPYVRPAARRLPLAIMGVRLRARHQSRRRARGTVPLSVSPAPS